MTKRQLSRRRAGSPSGMYLTMVNALCGRIVVGDLMMIINYASGEAQHIDTQGADITYTEWRANQTLLIAGHRRSEIVVGLYDVKSAKSTEVWASHDRMAAGRHANVSGFDDNGGCTLVGESFARAPEIAVIRGNDSERQEPL
jgi:hypothetical protein